MDKLTFWQNLKINAVAIITYPIWVIQAFGSALRSFSNEYSYFMRSRKHQIEDFKKHYNDPPREEIQRGSGSA